MSPMSPRLLRPRAMSSFADLRVGLVAYWPLNETATSGDVSAEDWTNRGNTLTSNNTVPSVTGKIGNGREFVAANSEWLSRADNADMRLGDPDWTLSAWVYVPSAANGTQMVIGKDEVGFTRDYSLGLERNSGTTANKFAFNLFYTTQFAGSVAGPNRNNADFINRWWFIAITNSAGVVTLYENGAVVSGTGSAPTFTRASGANYNASTAGFTIGRRIISPQSHFTGYVDEVAKWTRALSASDIARLWNNGNGIDLRR